MKCHFHEVNYYHRDKKPNPITERIKILGLDTEALTTGEPFMFAISDGGIYPMIQLLDILFRKEYRGTRFLLWNIHYDEGALYNTFL